MKKNLNYEIYESYSKKRTTKKYIVVSLRSDYNEVMNFAKKFFHCSEAHLDFTTGYVYGNELYLDDPRFLRIPDPRYLKGARKVRVVSFVR